MKSNSLEVIQSYILTTAKYDFSIYEKKVLYKLIQIAQADLKGKKLDKTYVIGENLFKDRKISMRYDDLMDADNRNYSRIRKALRSLRNKEFEYHTPDGWERLYSIIEKPGINKETKELEFFVCDIVWQIILNIGSKGWRKYELEVAMSFESIYAMRFYELVSNTKEGYIQQFTIDNLKQMFSLKGKYKRINDFVKRVLDPAKKELDKKAPYSFSYKLIKAKGSRKYTSVIITTVVIPQNQNEALAKKSLEMKTSSTWIIGKETKDFLVRNYDFDEKGIRANIELFAAANKAFDFQRFLRDNARTADSGTVKNKTGWIIGAIKKHLNAIEKKKTSKSDEIINDLANSFKAN